MSLIVASSFLEAVLERNMNSSPVICHKGFCKRSEIFIEMRMVVASGT